MWPFQMPLEWVTRDGPSDCISGSTTIQNLVSVLALCAEGVIVTTEELTDAIFI